MSIPSTHGRASGNGQAGTVARLWSRLNRPSARYVIACLFFAAGVVFWGGLNTAIDMSNTLEFCTTCHEMRDTVYQEYKQTTHYSNHSGVRAICSDCHVPRDWSHKIARKLEASLELWGKITGAIDTREKFESRRIWLASVEWARMKESDSRECRNCHTYEAMSAGLQKPEPYKKHMQAREEGNTCIDCHKGVAHKLPKGYVNQQPGQPP